MTHVRGFGTALLAAALAFGGSIARAGDGANVSIRDGGEPETCSDLAIEFDERPADRAEERLEIPAEAGKTLHVRLPRNSGAAVRSTSRGAFEVLACKAAPSADALSGIALSRKGETLTVTGPDGDDWVGYLLIAAPAGASIELDAVNGPISLSRLSGHVTARSQNGPISIRDCGGDIEATAQNGPVDVRGEGGRLRVKTQNGPIGVTLSGGAWQGEGLEASAVNGPVRLAIPAGYRSGAVVESLGHSPFRCRGEACEAARRTFDDDHKRIEFGEGPALVRLSTENGPVSVKAGSDVDSEED
jgi:hypothetical protein